MAPSARPFTQASRVHSRVPAGHVRVAWMAAATLLLTACASPGATATLSTLPTTAPAASVAAIPLPAPSLDPDAPAFPVPDGSVLLNAAVEGEGESAYRLAAWTSPLTVDDAVVFYADRDSGRWRLADDIVATPLGSELTLTDQQDAYDHAAVSVSVDPDGSRIAVRFLPAGGAPELVPAEGFGGEVPFGPLPPAELDAGALPVWALPEGASIIDGVTIGPTTYAELTVPGDPPAVLETYGRALDDAGIERVIHSEGEAIVIDLPGSDPPGTIVLSPDSEGTRVDLAVTP